MSLCSLYLPPSVHLLSSFGSCALFFMCYLVLYYFFFFSSRRRHTRCLSDWSSDVCSSDLSDAARVHVVTTSVLCHLQMMDQRGSSILLLLCHAYGYLSRVCIVKAA